MLGTLVDTTEQRPGPNDILIGHTTICEAARLISNTNPEVSGIHIKFSNENSQPIRFLRFLELCSLVEAVVLHDTLYTLPAELPTDVDELNLRKRLIYAGIVREYTSARLSEEIIPALTEWIVKNAKLPHPDEDITRIKLILTKMIDRSASRQLINQTSLDNLSQKIYGVNDTGEISRPLERVSDLFEAESELAQKFQSGILLGSNSVLNDIGEQIGINIGDLHHGSYETALPILRTVMYWQVADKIRLPWYPDVMRVPTMITLSRRLKSSLADDVYRVVAQAFETSVQDLIVDDLPYEVGIPPFAALLLSRCSKPEDVIDQILILRDEFTDFRYNFNELEKQRRNAKTIKERKEIRLHITNLFKAVASKYDKQDQSIFENVIGYTPEVIDLLQAPLDPEKYTGDLLNKPYEWIRDWWCSRPVSRLFSITKKLEKLDLYGQLVPRIFEFEITSSYAAFIKEHYSKMRCLTKPPESET
ncbi:hypothetical protein NIES4073_64570 [Kalymmatonema gypsitolerans NIES-4073]|nr:hypothetical protein NIES4073_64570 [Scytonema sp. NIES-4073]